MSRVKRIASRRGIQLLELVISLTTASVLMLGISSSVLIANRSLQIANSRSAAFSKTTGGLDRLRADLAEAYSISNRTATSVDLSVVDRTGDGLSDAVQYQWAGSGTPLQMSVNSGNWLNVTEDLTDFDLRYRTTTPSAEAGSSSSLHPADALIYQSHVTVDSLSSANISTTIPATFRDGDLLLAVVALNGNQLGCNISAGWTEIYQGLNATSNATLALYYTLSPPSSNVTIVCPNSTANCASIVHFSTPAGAASLFDIQSFIGSAQNPVAPAATSPADHCLVVRVLSARGPLVLEDSTNVPGHVGIAMRRQLLSNPILGVAYRYYNSGPVSEATFGLSSSADYATATLVIQP